jgi:hypothetical protein
MTKLSGIQVSIAIIRLALLPLGLDLPQALQDKDRQLKKLPKTKAERIK